MPSFSSVTIEYFPNRRVWDALRAFVQQVRARHPEVERVIVFGSLVRNEAVPGSDVDLLLVLRESSLPFLDRLPVYTPSDFPVPVDVFPYTREEFARLLEERNPFLQRALSEGKEISGSEGE